MGNKILFFTTSLLLLACSNDSPTKARAKPPPPTVHVFWYKAVTNQYDINTTGPGVDVSSATIHEGKIMSATVLENSGTAIPDVFSIGTGANDSLGGCAAIFSKDLCEMTGYCTTAILRGEYKDGWDSGAMCSPGPVRIRCGVVDFQGNIDVWGTPADVSDSATWQDFLNPLSHIMGYDMSNPVLMAEDTFDFTAAQGRQSDSMPSRLDGRFFEIEITNQVNWILDHSGQSKGVYSGQYAIVFLTLSGQYSSGRTTLYARENGHLDSAASGSDRPWTPDGNSMHIMAW